MQDCQYLMIICKDEFIDSFSITVTWGENGGVTIATSISVTHTENERRARIMSKAHNVG